MRMTASRNDELTPEQWGKVKAIFETALELTETARESYLAEACMQDSILLSEVKSLLEHYEDTGSFLQPPQVSTPENHPPDPSERIFLPGQLVAERFQILKFIGCGGMGEVYQARDKRLNEVIAIKAIRPEALSEVTIARFKQETLLARRITHPNVCRVFDLEQHKSSDGTPEIFCLTMEYVEGETLAEAIRQRGRMKTPEAVLILAQIGRALAASHAAGVVHRDLKPANVILNVVHSTMRAVVTDFGIAKGLYQADAGVSKLTGTNQIMGTAFYLAPEQIEGGHITYATDIYALGLIMYEVLTGTKPFSEMGGWGSAVARLKGPPPPLRKYVAEIGSRLESLILSCLAAQPEQRIQDVTTVVRSLEELIEEPSRDIMVHISAEQRARNTIAVLPFANMSQNPEDQYFSDGLSEELMGALAKLEGLRVVARTSVFRFRDTNVDIRAVAQQLSADFLVEGTVRRGSDRVRVTVRLINAEEGCHIWDERYDRQLIDVLSIQEEIASMIAGQLKLKLGVRTNVQVQQQRARSLEAYESFLKGRFFWNKRTKSNFQKAEQCFKEALNHDPEFAAALVGLADCYVMQGTYGASPQKVFPAAKDVILKALALDPKLPGAHCAAGYVHAIYDWDAHAGKRAFEHALELDPGYTIAHQWYSFICLFPQMRFAEARAHLKRAHQNDPLSVVVLYIGTIGAYLERKYDEAIGEGLRALEMDPSFGAARWFLGQAYSAKHMYGEAIAHLKLAADQTENFPLVLAALGYAQGQAGLKEEARLMLSELTQRSRTDYVSPFCMAHIALGLEDYDQALQYLNEALEVRAPELIELSGSPILDPIRSTHQFGAICRQIGLPNQIFSH